MSSTATFDRWSFHALGFAESVDPRPLWPLAGSLVLHVVVCVAIMSLRFLPASETPETFYQVTLVNLPDIQAFSPPSPARMSASEQPTVTEAPPVQDAASPPQTPKQQVEPIVAPGKPAPSVPRAEEAPPTEEWTRTIQAVPIPRITKQQPDNPASALVPKREPSDTDVRARGQSPLVPFPEPPQLARMPTTQAPVPSPPVYPSVASRSKWERSEQAIANLAIPELSAPAVRQPDLPPTVSETRVIPITLHAAGSSPDENPYWEEIKGRIHQQWFGSGTHHSQLLQVVLAFRVERTGQVNGLTIDRSSGHDTYDLMAQRAVVAASPFPPFPPTITEDYRDINFTFSFKATR